MIVPVEYLEPLLKLMNENKSDDLKVLRAGFTGIYNGGGGKVNFYGDKIITVDENGNEIVTFVRKNLKSL
jgi:hypothetical protein